MTVMATLQSALFGRRGAGRIPPGRAGTGGGAAGRRTRRERSVPAFVQEAPAGGRPGLYRQGGPGLELHTYCTMVSRTTSRQAEVLAVLTADPEHDLYMISSHGTTCALCAPYEAGCTPAAAQTRTSRPWRRRREGRPGRAGHTGQHLAEHTPQLPPCAAALDGGGPDR